MSARSRARKNKRRNLVPMWDLVLARQTHIWDVYAKKAKKLTGLFPVMFNPRQNGRVYSRNAMLKALGAGPIPVRAYNGEVLKGTIAHPKKVDKYGSVIGNIRVDPNEGPTDEWLSSVLFGQKKDNTCFSMRAIADSDKQPKEIIGWNLTTWNDTCSENVDTHLKRLQDWMGVSPEVLNVDPSLLGRQHGEFGGMCVPFQKSESGAAAEINVPFEAKSLGGQVNAFAKHLLKNISSIEGGCEEPEPQTTTALIQARILREKEQERTLKDIAQLQSLLGADKPFDDFYLNAPITVYEIPERYLDIKPDGEWFPNMEILRRLNELKVPHKSGPYMLAAVAANEYEEFREHLEKVGYAKLKVTRNVMESTILGDGQPTETRYFVFIVNWVAKANDPYGFRLDTQPTGLSDMMLKHILIHGETYGNK